MQIHDGVTFKAAGFPLFDTFKFQFSRFLCCLVCKKTKTTVLLNYKMCQYNSFTRKHAVFCLKINYSNCMSVAWCNQADSSAKVGSRMTHHNTKFNIHNFSARSLNQEFSHTFCCILFKLWRIIKVWTVTTNLLK